MCGCPGGTRPCGLTQLRTGRRYRPCNSTAPTRRPGCPGARVLGCSDARRPNCPPVRAGIDCQRTQPGPRRSRPHRVSDDAGFTPNECLDRTRSHEASAGFETPGDPAPLPAISEPRAHGAQVGRHGPRRQRPTDPSIDWPAHGVVTDAHSGRVAIHRYECQFLVAPVRADSLALRIGEPEPHRGRPRPAAFEEREAVPSRAARRRQDRW